MKILDVLGARISKTKLASPLREDFIINMIVNLALMFMTTIEKCILLVK